MNPLVRFVVERRFLAWALAIGAALAVGVLSSLQLRDMRERERLDQLRTQTERGSIEVMSQTLNGNLMGAIAVLGLIDPAIKQEARGLLPANNPQVFPTLESIGRSYDADGVFVVAENGIIASSWDNAGKPSTLLNVKFRPYYQMAMQGIDNVYAAVSLARGDRSLYFSAPVFSETTNGTQAIGAVVARTNLLRVDSLLRDRADTTLLLSPQGVVFASSRPEWVGRLAGQPTPERLKAIRELKQFGNMFEKSEPALLPLEVSDGVREFEGRRIAVAAAKVQWNDPFGDWRLVLVEDLGRTVAANEHHGIGALLAGAVLLVGVLILNMLRSHYRQFVIGRQLETFASEQERSAARKTRLAAVTVRLQRATDLAALVRVFLEECHALFGALQGVVYVSRDDDAAAFDLAGSYACAEPPSSHLLAGDGLLGQCAIERRLRVVDVPPAGYATIRSGLGDARPACVLIAPILLNDVLLGLTEIAVLQPLDAEAQDYFSELAGLLAMNIEITSRRARTEAVLSATQAAGAANAEQLTFQQALVDTIPYPVFYKDADTRFLGFNRAYEECFGVRRDELIGKRVLDLDYLPEADRIAYQAEDEATIAAAGSVRRELRMTFADGKPHDVIYFVSGFRRSDGSPGGLVGTFIDISEVKQAQNQLERLSNAERFNRLAQGREARILELKREINALAADAGKAPPYATSLVETVSDHELAPHPDYHTALTSTAPLELAELVDMNDLQKLFSSFCEAVGIAAAIIDLKGAVLAAARWQPACTEFHRRNPESCARCIESDTELALKLEEGKDFTLYTCKNGMTDAASPIVVEGQHLANVFIGQFHAGPPDLDFFRRQAQQFGYDEAAYLAAIQAAPVIAAERLPNILAFLSGFAQLVASMSLARQRADAAQSRLQEQAGLLRQERVAALSLAEDAEQARQALEFLARGDKT
jgi:PAS domain S-box-containing protein